jgi:hypothetical protein
MDLWDQQVSKKCAGISGDATTPRKEEYLKKNLGLFPELPLWRKLRISFSIADFSCHLHAKKILKSIFLANYFSWVSQFFILVAISTWIVNAELKLKMYKIMWSIFYIQTYFSLCLLHFLEAPFI